MYYSRTCLANEPKAWSILNRTGYTIIWKILMMLFCMQELITQPRIHQAKYAKKHLVVKIEI